MFGVPWSPSFVLGLPPRGGFWKKSKWPRNMTHSMPCKNPCRPSIHLAFTYSLQWSLIKRKCEANLDQLRLLHQQECSKCNNGHGLSVSYVKWPLVNLDHRDWNNDRGEPAVSYKWTVWIWEITGSKFKIAGKLPIIVEECIESTPI